LKHEGLPENEVTDSALASRNAGQEPGKIDRRSALRFPIQQDVRYKVFRGNSIELGSGKTVDMSSNGVLFTTERTLSPGERIEVAVSWPARLDKTSLLKLMTTGLVVRSEEGRAVLAIERYEFQPPGHL
jgi:hypothetical protein